MSGEPIAVEAARHGVFPHIFCWRGQRYRVQSVEACWTVRERRRQNAVARHCFRLRCAEGTFEVFQDVQSQGWHLSCHTRAGATP